MKTKASTSNRVRPTTRTTSSDWPVKTPIHTKPTVEPKYVKHRCVLTDHQPLFTQRIIEAKLSSRN